MDDFISRKAAIEAITAARDKQAEKQEYGWEWEYNGFNHAIQAIPLPSAQPEQRWIPCSERLPEESGNYLAMDVAEWIDVMWFTKRGKGGYWHDDVLAWMPLPEPYREGGE